MVPRLTTQQRLRHVKASKCAEYWLNLVLCPRKNLAECERDKRMKVR